MNREVILVSPGIKLSSRGQENQLGRGGGGGARVRKFLIAEKSAALTGVVLTVI